MKTTLEPQERLHQEMSWREALEQKRPILWGTLIVLLILNGVVMISYKKTSPQTKAQGRSTTTVSQFESDRAQAAQAVKNPVPR